MIPLITFRGATPAHPAVTVLIDPDRKACDRFAAKLQRRLFGTGHIVGVADGHGIAGFVVSVFPRRASSFACPHCGTADAHSFKVSA